MHGPDSRVFVQARQISSDVFGAGSPDRGAHMEYRIACRRVGLEEGIDFRARQAGGVDVLPGVRCADREKRQPLVVERRCDRSLEKVVEVEQVLCRIRCRCRYVEFLEVLFRRCRLLVELLLVQRVHDPARFEQCVHGLQVGG